MAETDKRIIQRYQLMNGRKSIRYLFQSKSTQYRRLSQRIRCIKWFRLIFVGPLKKSMECIHRSIRVDVIQNFNSPPLSMIKIAINTLRDNCPCPYVTSSLKYFLPT